MQTRNAKFGIGQVVKHRFYPFRGVIFDVDPIFRTRRNGGARSPPRFVQSRSSRFITCTPKTQIADT